MKKKLITAMVCTAMAASLLAACGGGAQKVDYGTGEIKVWVADNVVDFTNQQVTAFMEANPDFVITSCLSPAFSNIQFC